MQASYPKDGSFISARVVQWDDRWLIAQDALGLPYIHWYEDDARWSNIWEKYKRVMPLELQLRVGRKDGPRGRKAFVSHLLVDQPQLPNLSPYDPFVVLENTQPMPETVPLIEVDEEPAETQSINVRFEGKQAAFIRKEAKRMGLTNKELAQRFVKQAMALQGAL